MYDFTAHIKVSGQKLLLVFVAPLVALLLVAMIMHIMQSTTTTLYIAGQPLTLELAYTLEAQEKGLGGRSSMPENHGMLFMFADKPAIRCIWMKDMHFPLDILWLDSQKKIVHLEPNVSPITYPSTYCPPDPAAYVMELNAGVAEKSGMRVGQTLDFKL